MVKKVILEHAAVRTPFGDLAATVTGLLQGGCRISSGPFFGLPVSCAPFEDQRLRELTVAAATLSRAVDLAPGGQSTALIYCAAKGDLRALEESVVAGGSPYPLAPLLDVQAKAVAAQLGLDAAHVMSVSAACASGAVGVEVATELLRSGRFERVVLFGFDVLSRFVVTGFNALGALSPSTARPFDSGRDGLCLGEGCGLAVLSCREAQPGEIVIAGAGTANDANHRTGPSRTGDGLYAAAAAALRDAGIGPETIGGVKCHGTATPYNDAMEAKAIFRLFGENCPPCVSLKGAFGHLSGAGSLIEIIISARLIAARQLPPTIGYAHHGVDEPIRIAGTTQPIEKPAMLCLAAGFGGINAAVVLQEERR
jgi:3-oxoacyl-[acyl-carrier-protein] synthase-1